MDSGVGLLPLSLRATVAMGAILLAAATFPYTSHGPSAKSTQIREIKYRSSDDRRAEEKDKRDGGGLMEWGEAHLSCPWSSRDGSSVLGSGRLEQQFSSSSSTVVGDVCSCYGRSWLG